MRSKNFFTVFFIGTRRKASLMIENVDLKSKVVLDLPKPDIKKNTPKAPKKVENGEEKLKKALDAKAIAAQCQVKLPKGGIFVPELCPYPLFATYEDSMAYAKIASKMHELDPSWDGSLNV